MGIIFATLAYQLGKKTSKKHEHQQSGGDQTPPQQHYYPPSCQPQMGYMAGSAPYDPATQANTRSPYDPRASYAPTASESSCSQSPTQEGFGAARNMTPNGQVREIA